MVQRHVAGEYRVHFIGFTGGFPYLGGLPSELASIPRLSTPRQLVPKGSVGIAAGQTGVYSRSNPGGWHLVGRTAKLLFDPLKNPPTLLTAGDKVRFVPTEEIVPEGLDAADAAAAAAADEATVTTTNPPSIEVIAPGPITSIQDLGRKGFGRYGVSRTGAADTLALRMGNALLQNPETAAGFEVAMGGLKLKALAPIAMAVTGADCNAKIIRPSCEKDVPVRVNEVVTLQANDELHLGYGKDGARSYVTVHRGVDVPKVLGSRSTDLRAGLGGFHGRILRQGDLVAQAGAQTESSPPFVRSLHDPLRDVITKQGPRQWRIRVLPGAGDPGTAANSDCEANRLAEMNALIGRKFDVLPRSDRMAVCLSTHLEEGPPLQGGQQLSEACISGTIQLPPDGNPLILLAEHQTTGGYKVPAVVIQADLWQVGQMRPGDTLMFEQTTPERATEALIDLHTRARLTEPRVIDMDELDYGALTSGVNQLGSGDEWKDAMAMIPRSDPGSVQQMVTSTAAGSYALVPRKDGKLKEIDLNADAGEGFDDAGLLQYVTSVNIACGGHVGTPESIAQTVALAAAAGAGIGAHVAYPDPQNFGRSKLAISPSDLRDQVLWQTGALQQLCRGYGTEVQYIKPHGALYHTILEGGEQGKAVFEAAQLAGLPLLLMPISPWASYGEGFAERRYDGELLRPRSKEGAVIHCPEEAAKQALALAPRANLHTICVHGDSPNAVNVAKAVRAALDGDGYKVRPFVR